MMASAGGGPRRPTVVMALATLITLVAVVPLAILTFTAEDEDPAPSTGLLVSVEGSTTQLSGATFVVGTDAALWIDDSDLAVATWSLFHTELGWIASGTSNGASPFAVDLGTTPVAELDVGSYDLLVSGTHTDGSVVERAARFAINDSE